MYKWTYRLYSFFGGYMILIIGGSNQGKYDFAKSKFPDKVNKIIDNFEEWIKDAVKNDEDVNEKIDLLGIKDDAIIICDDISRGLVSIDPFERKYRDIQGRVLCRLASEAKEVYEVMYVIGKKIK